MLAVRLGTAIEIPFTKYRNIPSTNHFTYGEYPEEHHLLEYPLYLGLRYNLTLAKSFGYSIEPQIGLTTRDRRNVSGPISQKLNLLEILPDN